MAVCYLTPIYTSLKKAANQCSYKTTSCCNVPITPDEGTTQECRKVGSMNCNFFGSIKLWRYSYLLQFIYFAEDFQPSQRRQLIRTGNHHRLVSLCHVFSTTLNPMRRLQHVCFAFQNVYGDFKDYCAKKWNTFVRLMMMIMIFLIPIVKMSVYRKPYRRNYRNLKAYFPIITHHYH